MSVITTNLRAVAVPLLLAGCAAPQFVDPAEAGNHPANPNAPTARLPAPSRTLASDKNSSSATTTEASSRPVDQPNGIFTCPMHENVHAEQPGRCPICGMKLVKKDKEASDE